MSAVSFLQDVRDRIPGFDFSSCWRIVQFTILERNDVMDAELVVTCRDEELIRFRAEAVSKMTLSFTGNRMELGEPLISEHDEGICVHDELGHTIVLWCADLRLISVEPYETGDGGTHPG
jgi:hypothetical protein